ncbi:transporter substrate-binding domain-containing protein [Tistrella bauzanensis]|uniref:substrate-binding periplasmic protein n=1 Tax=Tistrella TaxID=171436 RepID=UPI0031F69C4A
MARFLAVMLVAVSGHVASALAADTVASRRDVPIGGYQFPPYVEMDIGGGPATGLIIDTIAVLNAAQDRWNFVFVPTTPARRYQDYAAGRFDLLLFEKMAWGWSAAGIVMETSRTIAEDGDVYIARAEPGRDESWFDDIASRRIAAILGYNYRFADFQNDPTELRKRFDIALVNDTAAVIALVLRGRVDTGVVTKSHLERYLQQYPDDRERVLVSARFDQTNDLKVLGRPGTTPSADTVFGLLADLQRQGRLAPLWQAYGLAPMPLDKGGQTPTPTPPVVPPSPAAAPAPR